MNRRGLRRSPKEGAGRRDGGAMGCRLACHKRREPSLRLVMVSLVLGSIAGCMVAPPSNAEWEIDVGFDGSYRTGSWTPLVVGGGDDSPAMVWVEDPDGELVGYPPAEEPHGTPPDADGTGAGASTRFRVRFGRPSGRVMLEGKDSGAGLVPRQLPPPLESTERVLLVVGELPSAERAVRLLQQEDDARMRVATVSRPSRLGPSALDLDGADAIIVCGTSLAETTPAAVRAVAAIDAWVRRGGRLVFLAGGSTATQGCRTGVAAAWLPGRAGRAGSVAKMVPLRRSAAVETYSKAGRPLDRGALVGLEVPLLEDPASLDGSIEAWEGSSPGDLPLVVRRAHGFGTVTWIGLDLDQAPFRTWQGTDSLLVELLGGRTEKAGRAGEVSRQTLDLGGQLRMAVDRFDGVRAVPFEIIAALAILYIACLYPLEWWVVSRGGQPRLAWLTLPAVVAAFASLAWWSADRWKGSEWHAHRADVVDVDGAGSLARGTSYLGIWSPVNATFDVGAGAESSLVGAPAQGAVSWFGASGRGIGAVDSPTAHPSLATRPYRTDAAVDRLEGVPVAASSSRLFEAEWMAPMTGPVVDSTLRRDAQGTLGGVLESRLPFALEQCALFSAGWYYDVGTLVPGGRFDPDEGKGPRTLAAALTRSATLFDRTQTERWRLEETDVDRILEIAGFHLAAGGEAYTSLEAGRLERIDLSPILPIDRAVLVGRGPVTTHWRWGGEVDGRGRAAVEAATTGSTALWRIVIPLEKTPVEKRSP